MKIIKTYWVHGNESKVFNDALKDVYDSIKACEIVIKPTKKGNGVKPIKVGVVTRLKNLGWKDEHPMDLEGMRAKPLDAFINDKKTGLRIGFEWETGNISSSFRALMKLFKGLIEDQMDLGVHVLPSREFYNFLTDRVGNIDEMLPYLDVFGRIELPEDKAVAMIVVEHDREDTKAKLIPKGLDGMSLKRRKNK